MAEIIRIRIELELRYLESESNWNWLLWKRHELRIGIKRSCNWTGVGTGIDTLNWNIIVVDKVLPSMHASKGLACSYI